MFFGFLFSLEIASMDFSFFSIAIPCEFDHVLFAIALFDFVLPNRGT
jgi:hypothetical protein